MQLWSNPGTLSVQGAQKHIKPCRGNSLYVMPGGKGTRLHVLCENEALATLQNVRSGRKKPEARSCIKEISIRLWTRIKLDMQF